MEVFGFSDHPMLSVDCLLPLSMFLFWVCLYEHVCHGRMKPFGGSVFDVKWQVFIHLSQKQSIHLSRNAQKNPSAETNGNVRKNNVKAAAIYQFTSWTLDVTPWNYSFAYALSSISICVGCLLDCENVSGPERSITSFCSNGFIIFNEFQDNRHNAQYWRINRYCTIYRRIKGKWLYETNAY